MSARVDEILSAQTHYGVLGVSEAATAEELRKAFRATVLLVHPDKCNDARAGDAVRRVNAAWATLGKEANRNAYDMSLARGGNGLEDQEDEEDFFGSGMTLDEILMHMVMRQMFGFDEDEDEDEMYYDDIEDHYDGYEDDLYYDEYEIVEEDEYSDDYYTDEEPSATPCCPDCGRAHGARPTGFDQEYKRRMEQRKREEEKLRKAREAREAKEAEQTVKAAAAHMNKAAGGNKRNRCANSNCTTGNAAGLKCCPKASFCCKECREAGWDAHARDCKNKSWRTTMEAKAAASAKPSKEDEAAAARRREKEALEQAEWEAQLKKMKEEKDARLRAEKAAEEERVRKEAERKERKKEERRQRNMPDLNNPIVENRVFAKQEAQLRKAVADINLSSQQQDAAVEAEKERLRAASKALLAEELALKNEGKKGKGKGKEAAKGKGKEAATAKGKGKEASKGKGKEAGKGKGKEAAKGKGKEAAKGKGKGKETAKGKGKAPPRTINVDEFFKPPPPRPAPPPQQPARPYVPGGLGASLGMSTAPAMPHFQQSNANPINSGTVNHNNFGDFGGNPGLVPNIPANFGASFPGPAPPLAPRGGATGATPGPFTPPQDLASVNSMIDKIKADLARLGVSEVGMPGVGAPQPPQPAAEQRAAPGSLAFMLMQQNGGAAAPGQHVPAPQGQRAPAPQSYTPSAAGWDASVPMQPWESGGDAWEDADNDGGDTWDEASQWSGGAAAPAPAPAAAAPRRSPADGPTPVDVPAVGGGGGWGSFASIARKAADEERRVADEQRRQQEHAERMRRQAAEAEAERLRLAEMAAVTSKKAALMASSETQALIAEAMTMGFSVEQIDSGFAQLIAKNRPVDNVHVLVDEMIAQLT